MGDVLTLVNGRAFKPTEWSESGRPIIRIQNLNNPDAPFNYYEGELPAKFLVRDGELLFAWSGTPGTSFGAHVWRGGEAWLNQHIFKVLFDEEQFDRRFLQLAINQNLDEYIRAAHGGAGLAHITKGRFEESVLPVPPLAEQWEIVARIETQLSRLEAGVTGLKRAQANLKRYRAAILKAACEGRLVPTEAELAHREDRGYETGTQLLARVLHDRRALWPGKRKYQDPPKAGNVFGSRSVDAVPEGWMVATVGQLLREKLINGVSVKGSDSPPGIRALRLSAMRDTGFDYSEHRYLPLENDDVDDIFIEEGDFFISRGNGSLHLVGRGTPAKTPPEPTIFPDTMIRLRLNVEVEATRWLQVLWSSRLIRSQIEKKVKTTAGIYKISQPQVEQIAFPLPPLAEQERIVAEVERRLSGVDELEATITANLHRATRLRQAVISAAFSGDHSS